MPPRTDWQEHVAPDERARFEEYGRTIGSLQESKARHRAAERSLHAKPHVGARARLTVLPDLPAPYRAGIFSVPAAYDAWVRFSNGSPRRQSDHTGDVRGLAVKVLGVPGTKLIPGLASARTQDFLMIQTPSLAFRNSDEFMFFVGAAQKPATLLPRLVGRFGFRRALALASRLRASVGRPIRSLAEERFWTPLPVRWGDHAAKYSALPRTGRSAKAPSRSADYLGDELRARLRGSDVEFDFAVQLYVDPERTPIEDASVEWREVDAPFVTVARLTIPQQDLGTDAGKRQEEYVERLSFDPWHAPVEFRPLGDMMRARNETYRVSTMGRKAAPEPERMEEFR